MSLMHFMFYDGLSHISYPRLERELWLAGQLREWVSARE